MEVKLGAEAGLNLNVQDGKLILTIGYDGKGVDGAMSASVDSDYFIDKLAALIPGDSMVEQLALNAIKLALKSVKV